MKKIVLLLITSIVFFSSCKKEEIVIPTKVATEDYYVVFGFEQNYSNLQISNIIIELFDYQNNPISPFKTSNTEIVFKISALKNCFSIIRIYAHYADPFTYKHSFIAPTTDLFNMYAYVFSFGYDDVISYHISPVIGVAKYNPKTDISTLLR